jgi:hypothetical protein
MACYGHSFLNYGYMGLENEVIYLAKLVDHLAETCTEFFQKESQLSLSKQMNIGRSLNPLCRPREATTRVLHKR